jgi:hypothetical protein
MKRNHFSGLNIAIFITAISLLIFMCAAISLLSYLAFSSLVDAATNRTARDTEPVRIRTIPDLEPVAPTPADIGPELHLAEVMEVGVLELAIHSEAPPVTEAPAEPVVSAPAAPTGPLPVEETGSAPEVVPTQDEAAEQAAPAAPPLDTAAASEVTTVPLQLEASPPVEDLSMVEVPAEPIAAQPVPPEPGAKPGPLPQKMPPAPTAPSEPSFVPDSAFFDQLLDQVE